MLNAHKPPPPGGKLHPHFGEKPPYPPTRRKSLFPPAKIPPRVSFFTSTFVLHFTQRWRRHMTLLWRYFWSARELMLEWLHWIFIYVRKNCRRWGLSDEGAFRLCIMIIDNLGKISEFSSSACYFDIGNTKSTYCKINKDCLLICVQRNFANKVEAGFKFITTMCTRVVAAMTIASN